MPQRPFGVILIALITVLSGALHITSGTLVLTGRMTPAGANTTTAWIVILVGTITLLIGAGLLSGARVARAVTTIGLVSSLITAVLHIFAHSNSNPTTSISAGFIAVIGLSLLYTGSANAHFANR